VVDASIHRLVPNSTGPVPNPAVNAIADAVAALAVTDNQNPPIVENENTAE
jgi:hypothetical protein